MAEEKPGYVEFLEERIQAEAEVFRKTSDPLCPIRREIYIVCLSHFYKNYPEELVKGDRSVRWADYLNEICPR